MRPRLSQPHSFAQQFNNIYCCPLSKVAFEDPVVAADGFTYERRSIEEYLKTEPPTSPITNTVMETTLLPNKSIRVSYAELEEVALQVFDQVDDYAGCTKLLFCFPLAGQIKIPHNKGGKNKTIQLVHHLARSSNPRLLEWCLKKGICEVETMSMWDTTPIEFAAQAGKIENLKILLKFEADVEPPRRLLLFAWNDLQMETVEFLLGQGMRFSDSDLKNFLSLKSSEDRIRKWYFPKLPASDLLHVIETHLRPNKK